MLSGPRDDDHDKSDSRITTEERLDRRADIKDGDTLAGVLDFVRTDGAYFHVQAPENLVGEVRGQIIGGQDEKLPMKCFYRGSERD